MLDALENQEVRHIARNPRKESKRRKRTGRVGAQKERVKSGMKYFKSWCKSLPCRVYMIDAARSDALDQS